MVTRSATLDGTTTVAVFGRVFSWFDDNLQIFNIWADTGAPTNVLNLTFAGSAWAVDAMTFNSATTLNLNITEANDGVARYVELMRIINGNATINLAASFIQQLRIGDPGQNSTLRLTLGDGGVGIVRSYDGNDVVTLGNGDAQMISLGDGINVVNGGAGFIQNLRFGDGTNTFNGGTGRFGSIRAEGNNNFNLLNGGESIRLEDGNNIVTLNSGQVESLYAFGNETINLLGDARILLLKMDEGVNRLTSEDGNIETIYAYHARNTIFLGAGGAQQIVLSGSDAAQVIHSDGWLGSLQVYAGDQSNVQATLVRLGSGGGGYIQTSQGSDHIITGDGAVQTILTFDGHDRVTLGRGGTQFVALGTGNDVVSLAEMNADVDALLRGGAGTDRVEFSRFASGVTASLDLGNASQDFGLVGAGRVSLEGFENLVGSAFADVFTGNGLANRMSGGSGADALFGLAGNDVLSGDRGADVLTGGEGLDTFLFIPADGSDRITDFTLGEDIIDLRAANGLADITFTRVGTDVRLTFGTLQIVVEDQTVAAMRDVDNFAF